MIKRFLCWLSCGQLPSVEEWAERVAPIAGSPDAMIAGHVIECIAKEFDEWRVMEKPMYKGGTAKDTSEWDKYKTLKTWWDDRVNKLPDDGHRSGTDHLLWHGKRKIYVFFRLTDDMEYRDVDPTHISVNFVPIDEKEGVKIWQAYERIKQERARLQRLADEALEKQKINEEKWNVYESLINARS
jgi:hypothetical protein